MNTIKLGELIAKVLLWVTTVLTAVRFHCDKIGYKSWKWDIVKLSEGLIDMFNVVQILQVLISSQQVV